VDRDTILEIAAAVSILAVAVWIGLFAVIAVALLIYLPTLLVWWYRRERKQRERN
jgi:Flp pilus assembly protein TadB